MLDKKNFYINGKWVKPSKANDFEVLSPIGLLLNALKEKPGVPSTATFLKHWEESLKRIIQRLRVF